MPIDIGLLRSEDEGGSLDQVRQWQSLRRRHNDNDSDDSSLPLDLLNNLQQWDKDRRTLLMQLQQTRHQIKTYQRWLSPRYQVSEEQTDEARAALPVLQNTTLPDLQAQLQQLQHTIATNLARVANVVDTSLTLDEDAAETATTVQNNDHNKQQPKNVVVDPLYSLAGYESLSNGDSSSVTILTGVGVTLIRSVHDAAIAHLPYPLIRLPSAVTVDVSTWHLLIGCCDSSSTTTTTMGLLCPACQELSCSAHHTISNNQQTTQLNSPSIVTLSRMHQKKTYFDRQLPMGFVVCCHENQNTSPWEDVRRRSFAKCKRAWFRNMTDDNKDRIEVFLLTGSTLTESRQAQIQLAHDVRDFYQSLLVAKSNNDSPSPLLRLKTIAPDKLLPCEASRIVLEGYLPSLKRFVVLAHVSNFANYLSQGCKTKCGHHEYVHTVHGLFSSVPETIEWMLQHNVLMQQQQQLQDEDDHGIVGIGLSHAIAQGVLSLSHKEKEGDSIKALEDGQVLFLPFCRRVLYGRGGNWMIQELSSSSTTTITPRVIQIPTTTSSRSNKEHGADTESTQGAASLRPPAKTRNEPFALDRLPKPSEIASEALSCPFDFLPLPRLNQ